MSKTVESVKVVSTHWDSTLETEIFLNGVSVGMANTDRDGQDSYSLVERIAENLARFHGVKLEKQSIQKDEPHPDQGSYDV